MEVELRNKEENKEVSLGTSKANYMDPRITVACCVETNQCVGCYHFSAMARPSWLGRAARNRHAIEQASRRWRVGRHDDSARTRRKILISTQVAWCKRCDLEISRLFPKTLKDKFNWAMGVEGDWRFEAAEVKKN